MKILTPLLATVTTMEYIASIERGVSEPHHTGISQVMTGQCRELSKRHQRLQHKKLGDIYDQLS